MEFGVAALDEPFGELGAFGEFAGSAFEFFEGEGVEVEDGDAAGEGFGDAGHEGEFLGAGEEVTPGFGARGVDAYLEMAHEFWGILDFVDDDGGEVVVEEVFAGLLGFLCGTGEV